MRTFEDYEAIAARLGTQPERLQQWRHKVRCCSASQSIAESANSELSTVALGAVARPASLPVFPHTKRGFVCVFAVRWLCGAMPRRSSTRRCGRTTCRSVCDAAKCNVQHATCSLCAEHSCPCTQHVTCRTVRNALGWPYSCVDVLHSASQPSFADLAQRATFCLQVKWRMAWDAYASSGHTSWNFV